MTKSEADRICDIMWQMDINCGDIQTVREALEMQIPKKVAFTVDRTWGIESKQPVCPVCDYYLTKTEFFVDGEKITYCEHCGNAIDWTEDNE